MQKHHRSSSDLIQTSSSLGAEVLIGLGHPITQGLKEFLELGPQ